MMNNPEKITELPKADLNHKDLYMEIMLIKENHLKHLSKDVDELKVELKEQRKDTKNMFEKVENRLWWLMGVVTVTMIGVIVKVVVGA